MNTDDLRPKQIRCPCCKAPVEALTFDQAADLCNFAPSHHGYKILKAVWSGDGFPVPTSKILDAMYADDIDGGPAESSAYNVFKQTKNKIRRRLRGTGVQIENAGYARGWRLRITRKRRKTNMNR